MLKDQKFFHKINSPWAVDAKADLCFDRVHIPFCWCCILNVLENLPTVCFALYMRKCVFGKISANIETKDVILCRQ